MRHLSFFKHASLVLSTWLVACSTIGSYVEGWPELKVTVHQASLWDINKTCWPYLPTVDKLLGSVSLACTVIDFNDNTCHVYLTPNSAEFVVNHELAHCKGGDHLDHSVSQAYDAWLDAHDKVSDHYDAVPPQLEHDPSGHTYWDHSSKFGPVPMELFSKAKEVCDQLNNPHHTYKAVGYHHLAQDELGKPFSQGGFFCVPV